MGEPVLRREVIRHMAALAGTGMLGRLKPLDRAPALPRPSRELPSLLATLTTNYRQLDNLAGPAALREVVTEHYHSVLQYLEGADSEAGLQALALVAADVAELAGWLAFDEERYGMAAGWYRRAAELSKVGGNTGLQAYALGRMSRLLSQCGDHQGAVGFAESAEAMARRRASPRTRSWLGATRAYVHACLRDPSRCRRDLDEASALLDLDDLPGDEPWLAFTRRPTSPSGRATACSASASLSLHGRSSSTRWRSGIRARSEREPRSRGHLQMRSFNRTRSRRRATSLGTPTRSR